ncbi:YbaB/EbfC family nucleoid-associated protein [Actinoplanes sp. NPDC051851]|uniref:YbaB/EbfC family nucleoid-associated protein n=1 Tax=Actinoplanes sp. NPDC051851 TaxID=3154753 RepID=UPI00344559F9
MNTNDLAAEMQRFLGDTEGIHQRVEGAISEVREADFTGTALDGGVTVTVSGMGALRGIDIHVTAKRAYDNITLGEAVTEAIRAAELAARGALNDRVLEASGVSGLSGLLKPEQLARLRRIVPEG